MFVACWREPGFHRSWRLWNPFFGHGLHRLHVALGGRRRPGVATLSVFLVCGALHDVAAGLFTRRVSVACTVAFAMYGLLTLVGHGLERRQARWTPASNVLANVVQLLAGLGAGVVVEGLVGAR